MHLLNLSFRLLSSFFVFMGALCVVKCDNISTIIHAPKEEEGEVDIATLLYHEEECLQHKYLGFE